MADSFQSAAERFHAADKFVSDYLNIFTSIHHIPCLRASVIADKREATDIMIGGIFRGACKTRSWDCLRFNDFGVRCFAHGGHVSEYQKLMTQNTVHFLLNCYEQNGKILKYSIADLDVYRKAYIAGWAGLREPKSIIIPEKDIYLIPLPVKDFPVERYGNPVMVWERDYLPKGSTAAESGWTNPDEPNATKMNSDWDDFMNSF